MSDGPLLPFEELIIKPEEVVIKEEQFSCNQCAYTSTCSDALEEHIKTHNDEKYSCDVCDFKTKHALLLIRHMKKHAEQYKCDECSYKCSQESDLKMHLTIHKEKVILQCDKCSFICDEPSVLQYHCKTHEVPSAHTSVEITHTLVPGEDKIDEDCSDFGIGIKTESNVNQEYVCEVCNAKCYDRTLFYHHFKTHSRYEPYLCSHCDYMCLRHQDLIEHCSKVHLEENKWKKNGDSFQCTHCDFEGTWDRFTKHLSSHYKELQHACSMCSYRCSMSKDLKIHMKKAHKKDDFILECQFCDLKTKSQKALLKHVRIQHKAYFRCCLCNFWTAFRARLTSHMKFKHNTIVSKFKRVYYNLKKCQICRFNAKSEIHLRQHMQLKHNINDKVFKCDEKNLTTKTLPKYRSESIILKKCDICNCEFKHEKDLVNHMAEHNIERIYSCSLCSYKGKSKDNLKTHMAFHKQNSEIAPQCDFCGYQATNKFVLRDHIRTHKKGNFFVCHLCDFKHRRKYEFHSHMLTVHGMANKKVTSETEIKCEPNVNCYQEIKIPVSQESNVK